MFGRSTYQPISDQPSHSLLKDLVFAIRSGNTGEAMACLYQYAPNATDRELIEQYKRLPR